MNTSSDSQFITSEQVKETFPRVVAKIEYTSPSDEDVYSTYISILTDLHDSYDNWITKAQTNAKWYQEKKNEAISIAKVFKGTPQALDMPTAPSEYVVLTELKILEDNATSYQQRENDRTQLRDELYKKQKEIDDRNTKIIGAAIIYVTGVFLCAASGQTIEVALLWPIIIAVALGILAAFMAGNS